MQISFFVSSAMRCFCPSFVQGQCIFNDWIDCERSLHKSVERPTFLRQSVLLCHTNDKKIEGPFSVNKVFRISCLPVQGNSDWSIDSAPLSDFFDEFITSCHIVLRL